MVSLSFFAHATPALAQDMAPTVWTCNELDEGLYGLDTWGQTPEQSFATDNSWFVIDIFSQGLTAGDYYRVCIYDSNVKYLDSFVSTPVTAGSTFYMGRFDMMEDYLLRDPYAVVTPGVPWSIRVYDMSGNFVTYTDFYVSYDGGGGSSGGGGGATLQSISAQPDPVTVYPGTTQQLAVTAHWSDGTSSDVTGSSSYGSYTDNIATVSGGGAVKGVALGSTTVSVSDGNASTTVTVNVVPPYVTSIAVNPDFIEMEVMGNPATAATHLPTTQQLAVTAYWSDGTSSDVTSTAFYAGYDHTVVTVSSSGLVTAGALSMTNTTITVGYDNCTAFVWIDVFPAKLQSISVSPSSVALNVGQSRQFTVMATYDNGTVEDATSGSDFEFQDSGDVQDAYAALSKPIQQTGYHPGENDGVMLATAVDTPETPAPGAFMQAISLGVPMWIGNGASLVTGEAQGATQVDVTLVDVNWGGSFTASVPVKVANPLVSIAVQPNPVMLLVKGTQQLKVTATWYDGTTSDVTQDPNTSYTGNDSAVATVYGGLVTGVAAGSTGINVTYTDSSGNIRGAAVPVTVEPAPTYTVTYCGNGYTGGSVPTDSTAYPAGTPVTVKGAGDMVRADYTFIGWNTQADYSGTSFKAGATFDIEADTALYAVWLGGRGTESFPILPARPSYFEQL
jgi:hypothetical protein